MLTTQVYIRISAITPDLNDLICNTKPPNKLND